ncbi:MAG: hypothetical protein J4415_02185 [Candidatus Diapherotrites archaeon]|uniref:Uncharacterized protein n=1 Tax=Candidatus Iainarchaeum sp. TaxID=3101447 RepID=A0A8T4KQW9_9ARCH|nr:hypothetical protein [Candidatus Diapherotrites archaeon]
MDWAAEKECKRQDAIMRYFLFWFVLLLLLSALMLFVAEDIILAAIFSVLALALLIWKSAGKEIREDIAREAAEMEKAKTNVPELSFAYDWSEKEPGANPFAIVSQGCKNFIDGMKKVFKR